MITAVILISVIIAALIAKNRTHWDSFNHDLSFLTIVFASVGFLIHLIFWGMTPYNYKIFEVQRDSFVETLTEARENNREYELAAITREVAQWNKDLATAKYNNSIPFIGQYVDDRVENLKPIK